VAEDFLDALAVTEDAAEVNAAAVALALDGASARPELSASIAAFLKEQSKLMEEQREQLHDQVKRLKLAVIDQRFSIVLKAMTALIGFGVAGALAFVIWNASGSGGLVIEPFSIPPDLSARGLTGQVVASKLLDRLLAMQQQTDSQRDPATYTNYWGDNVKVEIPSTGVSIGELERFLREKLGHPTHITGEIVRDQKGLSLTARVGTLGSGMVRGGDGEVDALVQKLAEHVYGVTEPYRYGAWLREYGREQEGLAVFIDLARHGPASERPWGYLGWGNALEQKQGIYARLHVMQETFQRWPTAYLAGQNVALIYYTLSRPESAVAEFRAISPLLSSPEHGGVRADVVPIAKERVQAFTDMIFGDYGEAAHLWEQQVAFGPQGVTYNMHAMLARSQLGEHDVGAARATMADPGELGGVNAHNGEYDVVTARMLLRTAMEDWRAVLDEDRAADRVAIVYPGVRTIAPSTSAPLLAYAHARLGDFNATNALIARTPGDCYLCIIVRGRVAELERQHSRADWWFARAVGQQPSIPFAYSEWGAALLARGKVDDAIAKFTTASQKGPHFADPLEMWGEALIVKKRSDLALAKFDEANKYAPKWGRLHLKWGEALLWSGDKTGAQKQISIARALDLTPPEKSELHRASTNVREKG
jgi:tetratricopeptide (TPR) repeat protein